MVFRVNRIVNYRMAVRSERVDNLGKSRKVVDSYTGRRMPILQTEPSKLVPLSLQNKFCPHKGYLPTAVQRSDVHRCFASRKEESRGIEQLTYKGYETPTNQSLSVAAYHGRTPEPEGKNPFPTSP